MTVTEDMCHALLDLGDLPENVRAITIKCILDIISASIAGYETESSKCIRMVAQQTWGHGQAPVWFENTGLTSAGATFVNTATACALDIDDGHRRAAGHPGVGIIPAICSLMHSHLNDTERFIKAIAIGYEVGIRISASRDLKSVPTTNTGLWCGQAVAAAVAWLQELTATQTAHAISIAGTTAPCQSATPYTSQRGNNVKEGIPWGSANGILSVDLASQGFTGPLDILDASDLYDSSEILDGIGKHWHILNTYFKPYSCCRWLHAPIDGLLELMENHDFNAADIEKIAVQTFSRTLTLNNEVKPLSFESAQYSLPFCISVAAIKGANALLPLSDSLRMDRDVLELSKKVTINCNRDFDAMFPSKAPGQIEVTLKSGNKLQTTVFSPKGDPDNPMEWDEIESKFISICLPRRGEAFCSSVLTAISALNNGDLVPLSKLNFV